MNGSSASLAFQGVQAMEARVCELQKDKPQHIENLCLGGYCSKSCGSSYRFGKQVAKKLKNVTELKTEGQKFKEVAERVPEDPADEVPVDQPKIVGQESSFDQVWGCLGETEVGVIGLYGPGGVGKTTLLKQINNRFCHEPHQFDYVIWVVVSKEVSYEKIQEDIGKKIGFFGEPWKNKSLADKAYDIFKVLRIKKFVLLLDDIWQRIELFEIGVPLPNLKNKSKIIFTTRSRDVCGQMGAKRAMEVKNLSPEKAWELFQGNVQNDVILSHPRILELAKKVANECGGLPLVLLVVARTMACKTSPEEWEDAIQILRGSVFQFQGTDKAYPRLKFSYDNLQNEKTKSCFLYCSLYPEDCFIPKNELVEYWLCEGYVDEYNRGYSIIGDLVHACLLEEEENDRVKMHDVIRDMAIRIASETEEESFLICTNAKLTKAPEIRKWEGVRRISFMSNEIKNLSKIPNCPHLVTLFLQGNSIEMIANDFFQFMPSLKVLNLSQNHHLTTLPSGFSKLASLLQYLNLSRTSLQELPEELKEFVNLKHLDISFTQSLHTIPRQLISSFSRLKVLKMIHCGTVYGGSEVSIEELIHLKHLSGLEISVKTIHSLHTLFSSSKLYSCTQYLNLTNMKDVESLGISSLAAMKHLDTLALNGLVDLKGLKIDCGGVIQKREALGFNSLQTVYIWHCPKLREVTWLVFAPCLRKLYIQFCHDLEEMIDTGKVGEAYKDMIGYLKPFAKLEILDLRWLQNLKSIFREALPFVRMKQMSIMECPKLNSLPLDCHSRKFEIRGEGDWWKELQWKDEATRNAFLPLFKPYDDDEWA